MGICIADLGAAPGADGCAGLPASRKKTLRRWGLVLLAWLAAGNVGSAASWYVDNAATGSRNGTSWANAWTSFSSIVWGSSGVNAGDTVYISGGSSSNVYTESWSVQASGTASSRITFAIDAANSAHNGTVIFDYDQYGDSGTVNGITLSGNYITFNGNVNGANHFQMNNLRNILAEFTTACLIGNGRVGETFDHLDFTNDNTPIKVLGSTGTTVRNCRFFGVRGNAAVALGSSTGTWDSSLVYSNYIEVVVNTAMPPGATDAYVGPDGIETSAGVSIFNNTFKAVAGTVYTSYEHTDFVQGYGNYLKIYNNEFINIGDSAIDIGRVAVNSDVSHIWIYNNLFHIEQTIDGSPEYIRIYTSLTSQNTITNLADVKILNNDFIDNNKYVPIRMNQFHANPTASAVLVANNIFYSVGGSSNPVLLIDPSTNFTAGSFTFDSNIYYNPSSAPSVSFNGTSYPMANWIGTFDIHGKTAAPTFANYSSFAAANDFHLSPIDTVAKDAGMALGSYFTSDKDSVARPQGPAWDIGAYEYHLVTGTPALALRRTGPGSVGVSWPSASTGWRLQTCTNLSAPNWTDVLTSPVNDGTNQTVSASPIGPRIFYRLRSL
jgi:hypothetical protein